MRCWSVLLTGVVLSCARHTSCAFASGSPASPSWVALGRRLAPPSTCAMVGAATIPLLAEAFFAPDARNSVGGVGGCSWVASRVTGSSRTLHGVAAVDTLGLTAVAVGAAGTILRTDDGGGSWSSVLSGVSGDLLTIAFISQVRRHLSSGPLKPPSARTHWVGTACWTIS